MSDPTIPSPQKTGDGRSCWTSTWSDPRRPGEKRGRTHCKRFGRVDKVKRGEALRRWQRWLEKEFPALKHKGAAKYPVDQLCQDYFAQMGKRYIVDGKHTTSIVRIRIALDSFRAMYGSEEAGAMNASKVGAWLESSIHERLPIRKGGRVAEGPKTKETVNLGLSYIKRMFRWGAKYNKIADVAAGSVQLVENIRADNPDTRKKESIRPVAWDTVVKTLAVPAGKRLENEIMVLWHTGMRPGEMLSMRPCDIDMGFNQFVASGPQSAENRVWVYTPSRHKNKWRGQERKIPIGPKARAIIEPLLPSKTDAPIFRRPWNGKPWTTQFFYQAVGRAAALAKVEPWHPNQIRHSYATRIEDQFGAETVTDMLGHDDDRTQRVYVEKTLRRAMDVARQVG